jgi:hypothetical protein
VCYFVLFVWQHKANTQTGAESRAISPLFVYKNLLLFCSKFFNLGIKVQLNKDDVDNDGPQRCFSSLGKTNLKLIHSFTSLFKVGKSYIRHRLFIVT